MHSSPARSDGNRGAGYGTGSYGVGAYENHRPQRSISPHVVPRRLRGVSIANPRDGAIFWWQNNHRVLLLRLITPRKGHLCARHASTARLWRSDAQRTSGSITICAFAGATLRTRRPGPRHRQTMPGILSLGRRADCLRPCWIWRFVLVWTSSSLLLNLPWRSLVRRGVPTSGATTAAVGPNAVCVVGQTAYWISPCNSGRMLWGPAATNPFHGSEGLRGQPCAGSV